MENCLFHGLIDEETGEIFGTITVSINNASNQIIIRVRDNGKGIPEEKLDLLNNPGELTRQLNDRGRHIGLSNIRQRLSYIYNGHANMIINNDSGTVVTLYLPEYPTKFS
ncbi:MAG: sensor histidine kinase [Catenibacillus sp.]